jgi:hypothetical protein
LEVGVGPALEEQPKDHESGHCIRIEAAMAGNSMAYDSFGSTASALSGNFVGIWLTPRIRKTGGRPGAALGSCPRGLTRRGSAIPQGCACSAARRVERASPVETAPLDANRSRPLAGERYRHRRIPVKLNTT